jgi:hypothetical protein
VIHIGRIKIDCFLNHAQAENARVEIHVFLGIICQGGNVVKSGNKGAHMLEFSSKVTISARFGLRA